MTSTPTWNEYVQKLITDYCNERGSRTFTLPEFNAAKEKEILSFSESAKTPFATVRRELQTLRDKGILTFVDNKGTYTLRNPVILKNELMEEQAAFIYDFGPSSNKKEYIHEAYARDRGWVKEAKDVFGLYCLHPKCANSFNKPDGLPYIEVHHIIPLFEGGEDAIWNLAVVCAHHHKMAHFADHETQLDLRKLFLKIVESSL